LFSGDRVEPPKVVSADNPDGAIREAIRKCSCLELEQGVTFTVRPVGDPIDTTYKAQYDGLAFRDHCIPTDAKLRIRKFKTQETELELEES
jgi:uncharacterized Fe-S cluster-containing protein